MKGKEASVLIAHTLDTPFFSEIFRGASTYQCLDMRLFFMNARVYMVIQKNPFALKSFYGDDGGLECCFLLIPSISNKYSFCEEVSAGLLECPFRCGIAATFRLMAAASWMDTIRDKLAVNCPNGYLSLEMMVVNGKQQGRVVCYVHHQVKCLLE